MAFGISFGVIISIKVPFFIQSADTFQVANRSSFGVAGVRSNTIPTGEYPDVRRADFKRNLSAPALVAGETGTEPAQRTGKDACVTLASICRIGSTKIA